MIPAQEQQNHARRHVRLVLSLVGLISVTSLVTSPIRLAPAKANTPTWSYTGSLKQARAYHTATLLADGKVLVVAGSPSDTDALDALASAELYDPVTGTWSFTGSLNVPRAAYTATLLANGNVLVVGGHSAGGALASTELYDPSTGAWSVTGSLNVPRAFNTATLLANGKVLVAGGFANRCCEQSDLTKTAELYDPTMGRWSLTGMLSETRVDHTATLLQDGKVLVAGGDQHHGSAELYDANTGTWSITGSLNTPRLDHTLTTLLNGSVLMSGGVGSVGSLKTAELYNPATGRWSYTGSFRDSHIGETATLLESGQVLVLGGWTDEQGFNAELYNPATGKWSTTASPNTARNAHTATLLSDGKVLVVGGYDGISGGSAELYDPEILDPAPTAPIIIMASVSGKKLFITGENFHAEAVVLLNGVEQKSKNDAQNPQTVLIGKKAGKKVKPGDQLQVRNPDGTLSDVFIFTGS